MTTIPNKIKELIKAGIDPYVIITFWIIYQEGKIEYKDILDMLSEGLQEYSITKDEASLLDCFLEYLEDIEHIITHSEENDTVYYSVDYGRL